MRKAKKRGSPKPRRRLSEQYQTYFVPRPCLNHGADSPSDLRQPPALKPVPSVVTYGVEEAPITQ